VSADDQHDHYGALDVAPSATAEEIQQAWRFKLLAYHPDKFRDDGHRERAEEITKRANAAWQVLGDATARARYDRGRAARPVGLGAVANGRRPSLPCPSCATLAAAPRVRKMIVDLKCSACGENFRAMVRARCLVRPWLERRWLGLKYSAVFGSETGERKAISFRRLPKELAMSEGELFSLVFHPRRGNPVYAVVHHDESDLIWKVS
jgi:curved DNA-binding protein CbpA